jgi:AcrR family transcriptional regulator
VNSVRLARGAVKAYAVCHAVPAEAQREADPGGGDPPRRRRGLDRLSTRVLARRLGARAPSLYHYFPDMESLVCALSAGFLESLAREVDCHESLAGMARAYWDYASATPTATPSSSAARPTRRSRRPPTGSRSWPRASAWTARRWWRGRCGRTCTGRSACACSGRRGGTSTPRRRSRAGLAAFEAWLAAGAGGDRAA